MHRIVSPTPLDTGRRLTLEWTRLRTRPGALERATAWQLADEPLRDLDHVLALVGFRRPLDDATEQRLRRLVILAADDDLAGRVVIQRILPGLLAVVSRRRRMPGGDDVFDELLSAAWLTIRTFNPARRPACLAAALISDADYRAFRSVQRRRDASTIPVADVFDEQPAPHTNPSEELSRIFDEALVAGVPPADIELMRQLIDAPTTIELARQLDITPRTIRNRRARITDRLREVALAA